MFELNPNVLNKLRLLGTEDEEFIYDSEILEIIRFLMGCLSANRQGNCESVEPIYNALLDALQLAQVNGYDIQLPSRMYC